MSLLHSLLPTAAIHNSLSCHIALKIALKKQRRETCTLVILSVSLVHCSDRDWLGALGGEEWRGCLAGWLVGWLDLEFKQARDWTQPSDWQGRGK